MEVDLKASNGDCTESIDPEICQQECSMILEHQVDENTTSEDYSGLLAMKIVNYDGREKRTSILDCVQLSIEYFLGGDADWWPLPPLNHLQSPQQARLCWQYGDCELSIILNKDEEVRCREAIRAHTQGQKILPLSQPVDISTGKSTTSSSQVRQRSVWDNLLPGWWLKKSNSRSVPVVPGPVNPVGMPQMEFYLCIDQCWTPVKETRMTTVCAIEKIPSDMELFHRARCILGQATGNLLQRQLSWRSYTRINLSRFHFLFDNSDIVATFDISNLSQVQPTDVCKGYDFTRRGEFPIDIQMRVYAETILYGIRYLELGRDKRTVLDGIPKLKAPPGLKREAMMIGWGFHAGQGLCVRKLLGLISFTLAFGLAFVPYWLASIDKLDLQNALAPVSFLATLIGIGLAMLAIAHAG